MKLHSLQIFCFLLIPFSLFGQQEKEWRNLFNGKDLTGWKQLAGKANYKAEDGAIVGTTVANSGNAFLVTEKEYGDFILELDVFVEDTAGNSGIQVRSHYDAAGSNGAGLVEP